MSGVTVAYELHRDINKVCQQYAGYFLSAVDFELGSRVVTEDDVVRIVRSYIEGLFPKVCPRCGRRFDSLREYLNSTTHLGSPYLYETPDDDTIEDPLGPIARATCQCGNTLTVGSRDLPKAQLVELLGWAKADARRRSISMTELLREIRDRIDHQVLTADEYASLRNRRVKDSR